MTSLYNITMPTTTNYLIWFSRHFLSNDIKILSVLAGTTNTASKAFLIYTFDGISSYQLKFAKDITETNYRTRSQVLIDTNKMMIGGVVDTSPCLFRL